MLIERKIHKFNARPQKETLNIVSAEYEDGVVTIHATDHNVMAGSKVYFERQTGDGTTFTANFQVFDVVDKDTFKINYVLDDYRLHPSLAEKVEVQLFPMSSAETYLQLTYYNADKHICSKDRTDVNIHTNHGIEYEYGEPVEKCVRTYDELFNDITYYRSSYIDEEGNRVFDEGPLNIMDHYVWYTLKNNVKLLGKCFVPFSNDSYDNRNVMLFEFTEDAEDVLENFASTSLKCNDCRFFKVGNIESLKTHLNIEFEEGTSISYYNMSINLSTGLVSEFGTNLTHEEDIVSYINKAKTDGINGIIDYEKQMFSPVHLNTVSGASEGDVIDDSDLSDIKSIRFNIFLRDRVYDESSGDWYAPDEAFWASRTGNTVGSFVNEGEGDLLGSMGFTDEDVYNQNKRLAKTFVRLSFYDTTDRATQKLLYYSTIFLNAPKQYAKYMKNISAKVGMDKDGYVNTENSDDSLALCCNFECYDKFNMSGSSEGFYLYLYPDAITGATLSSAYMKVEFNNAKYGKTIPLIHPMNEDGTEKTPGLSYQENFNGNGAKFTNLYKLYNDMYIKVLLKYDYTNNRYVWFLPYSQDSDAYVFNMYEARIIDTNSNN